MTSTSAADGAATTAKLETRRVGDIAGHFLVPGYQRGYRWGRNEVEQLLNDVRESEGRDYYLQPVVVRRGDDVLELIDGQQRLTTLFELIDGQQRLTTLFLIHGYIKTHLPTSKLDYLIEYETRPLSAAFLADPVAGRSRENIDFFHIYEACECIREWFEDKSNPPLEAMNFYKALAERVYVIWYEVPPEVDARVLFTRLNVGRIPLTDAELVKAVLLSKSGDRRREVAAQWDNIERDLRHPDVWSFVSPRDQEDATRIGLLLDTLSGGALGAARPKFKTFEALNRRIGETSAEAVWKQVVASHARVMSWYEDPELYHKIGFLVAVGFGLDKLVEPASTLAHSKFKKHLNELIRGRLKLSRSDLVELRYRDYEDCSRVLLLTNVEAVLRQDSSERYSFTAHAKGDWTLEHIEPQADTPLTTTAQQKAWLESHRDALRSLADLDEVQVSKLVEEIDAALADLSGPVFRQLAEKIAPLFRGPVATDTEYEHSLANLALLAGGDNSVLSNSWFEVKRRHIIKLDRSGSYIPLCTRNVFLKYFTGADAQQIHFWSPQDRDAYLEAILDYVGPYLTPPLAAHA